MSLARSNYKLHVGAPMLAYELRQQKNLTCIKNTLVHKHNVMLIKCTHKYAL